MTDTSTTGTFTDFGEIGAGWQLVVSVGSASSRVVALGNPTELVFGRHPGCSIVVEHDGVSRRHARLARRDTDITVEDLGSHNGTLVNGVAIRGVRRLGAGDVVSVGPATAMLAIASGGRRDRFVATLDELEERVDVAGRRQPLAEVIAVDPQMKHVFALAARVAQSPITVLVTGETGVGKEVVADAIHRLGARRGPLVKLNCAALPEHIVEAELFGYEKGAFTGAIAARQGYFESAAGGTLFLDEIGELPLGVQGKLLRATEQRTIVRVGGTRELPIDVRMVCATNRDLEVEVARGRFRQDLYFRIGAFVIPVPPLRDRKLEISLLAMRFGRADLDDAVRAALEAYDWPGNVRELRNVIERALVMSGGYPIALEHLPDRIRGGASMPVQNVRQKVADVERDAVLAALHGASWNQTHAARALGITRFALIRLMQKHGLKRR